MKNSSFACFLNLMALREWVGMFMNFQAGNTATSTLVFHT